MKNTFRLLILILLISVSHNARAAVKKLPPIETLIAEPIAFENVNLWAIADKQGPVTNRGCQIRKNCLSSVELKSYIEHTKKDKCPSSVALELAIYCQLYHQNDIPLTIIDNWQWKCDDALSQFDSVGYDLSAWGGSWQTCLEAVKTITSTSSQLEWIDILDNEDFIRQDNAESQRSDIEIRTFSEMRTRDGYPQERKL